MGAGALAICHNRTAVRIKEDMKKIVQLPLLKQKDPNLWKVFGVSLLELEQQGRVKEGIPGVVRSMVEYIKEHGLQTEGLFRVNGNVKVVERLRLRFESEERVDLLQEADICSVASLLKQYLRDLPEGVITSTVQPALLTLYQECNEDQLLPSLKELLQQLPDIHYRLLKYLCHFLTQVEKQHKDNRMTAFNLATVFGPNIFHVSAGFEGMQEQDLCNKVMVKLIQDYIAIFETEAIPEEPKKEHPKVIAVKEMTCNSAQMEVSPSNEMPVPVPVPRKKKEMACSTTEMESSANKLGAEMTTPVPRKKKATCSHEPQKAPIPINSALEMPTLVPRTKKVKKSKSNGMIRPLAVPQPSQSAGAPQVRLRIIEKTPSLEDMDLSSDEINIVKSADTLSSSQEDERPISPFYMSAQISTVNGKPSSEDLLERTIRSAVEQHLFDVHGGGGQSSEDSESGTSSPTPALTARQRRRQQKDQDEVRKHKDMEDINKENIPSLFTSNEDGTQAAQEGEKKQIDCSPTYIEESMRQKKPKSKLPKHKENQVGPVVMDCFNASRLQDRGQTDNLESLADEGKHIQIEAGSGQFAQTSAMKIQEVQSGCETARAQRNQEADVCEESSVPEVPRLDLSALTEDSNWGDSSFFTVPVIDFKSYWQQSYYEEPVPAYSSWQRESMDGDEAHLSPQAGGRLIRQLLEEDSDPMLSPRFYAFGQSQQYLDDTEVPPSPPNAHSFMRRRRSSSLGSCEDDKEELSSAHLSKKIHSLKKKIRKYEEKFEEERKYRPSHSDKTANPEVLRWMNELAKLRKELKEMKLKMSEEDLPPLTRQRSNTLPKSFGSQLEKEPAVEKAPKPPVESTLETVLKKLQEKRAEVSRPEDIKDMTREQIGAEKVALQKALLYYESIHGRPITKSERQVMKPLYDKYRLVKQILCRATSIPIIGSPSSKRRGPLLQPIIEGEPALFFEDIKEEEDGSEDESNTKADLTVTVKTEFNMRSFLDQLDEEVDGFISPVDEISPSKHNIDMRLSNLHSATMPELVEQLQEAREDKKRIRKKLREFEDKFFRQNGRNVQKEDRTPMAEEYNEYKHVKAKLRLLEVLISKRDS
ncbi:protein FAM13A isoform X2 [Amia ocellicauda]|uniref:protein FAM13A isoform X2 n=1 Tax=Amia ocellicauda TaxID=2972642 RepID=UPI003464CE3D